MPFLDRFKCFIEKDGRWKSKFSQVDRCLFEMTRSFSSNDKKKLVTELERKIGWLHWYDTLEMYDLYHFI